MPAVPTSYENRRPELSTREGSRSDVDHDGTCHFFCGRAADTYRDEAYKPENLFIYEEGSPET